MAPKKNVEAQKQKKHDGPKAAKNKSTVLSSLASKSNTNGDVQKNSKIVKTNNIAKKNELKTIVAGKRDLSKTETGEENPVKLVDIVLWAFEALDNHKGSSLQAVKEYLKENVGADLQKAVYIHKLIRKLAEEVERRRCPDTRARGPFTLA